MSVGPRIDGLPTAAIGDRAILGERGFDAPVQKVPRDHVVRELAHRARVDRGLDRLDGVLADELAAEVPVRIERDRVALAEPQMKAQADHAVREQHVEIGAGVGRERVDALERGARSAHGIHVVILRVEPLAPGLVDHLEETVDLLRAAPGRLEGARLVELRDQRARGDRRAAYRQSAGVAQLLDARADQLVCLLRAERAGGGQRERCD